MKIKVIYFAAMREQANKEEEVINIQAKNASELFQEINKKYHFTLEQSQLKVAINEEYKCFSTPLSEMDTVVFIPPVAGG